MKAAVDQTKTIVATLLDANTVEAAGQVRRAIDSRSTALARALIKEGHDPEMILVTRWKHGTPSFKPAPLRVFAKWTVTEGDRRGLGRRPHQEWPGKRTGQPQERDLAVSGTQKQREPADAASTPTPRGREAA